MHSRSIVRTLVLVETLFFFAFLSSSIVTAANLTPLIGKTEAQSTQPSERKSAGVFGCTHFLNGTIARGDAAKVKLAIETYGIGVVRLCLNSTGGDFAEAVKISRIVISSRTGTALEPHSKCLSACAFIFMAGSYGRSDVNIPSRVMHVTATLGFHAPFIDPRALPTEGLSPEDVAGAHEAARIATQELIDIFVRPEFVRWNYDRDLWMKPSLLRLALAKDATHFFYIDTIGKAGNFNIGIRGFRHFQVSRRQQMRNLCKNIHLWKLDRFDDDGRVHVDQMSQAEVRKQRQENGVLATWFYSYRRGPNANSRGTPVVHYVADQGSGGIKCIVELDAKGNIKPCTVWLISDNGEMRARCSNRLNRYDINTRLQ
jgi:hypothetical protein